MTGAEGLLCTGCQKTYGRSVALDGVSLGVGPGEVVGLVGPNGAGKTTLLHAVTGLLRLDGGRITLDGVDARRPVARARMAFMPDDLPRPRHLTGRELVELTCRLYGVPVDELWLEETAARFDLGGRLDERMSGFSHGMGRKVDLIASLAVHPDLLVLDEPFSGLDPIMVDALAEEISRRRDEGLATLLSTHDLELAALLSDRVVVIRGGRVVVDDTPARILAQHAASDIRQAFRTLSERTP